MATPSRHLPPGLATTLRVGDRGGLLFERLGHQATFLALVLGAIPRTVARYRRQTGAILVDMIWGNGSLVVGGGTIGVLAFMGAAIGGSVGVEGYAVLDMVGMGPLTGFISAYANTREMAPMIAAIGFGAQAGTRMTAEIGAMRIAEEIDALEAQGIPSIPYVVTPRVVAGMITIIPLYLLALALSYLSCALVVNLHQASGTYYHYFDSFIQPSDVGFSVIKAIIFVTLIVAIHGYEGYYAGGGPEGVGHASGRAIRASLITVVIADMVLTLLFWGNNPGLRLSG
ncbi:MlaE family ABC transporter permease [Mycobacterium riyadhense]|uniref:ABC transporter permease n=1 Tax=Mycobacterium riyadhense TaxID=486698 RepID=A0A1X2CJA8_9MYCO|nr:ABC transporter permease [Mycobacterium riyadhense]MCV7147486.1 ABC transporter permease [Mycobacterium riyadhense]ORW75854.1 ABC transporter permease [Mycobacterium riyadhense]VTO97424.1 putative phospholipid ABC transporter permease protein MlaE [Mycobacterium riyadhense]